MKRIITFILATGLCAFLATGCQEEYTTYSDAEYVMFSDSVSLNMVLENQDYFTVPVASTTACDYDRTFGVEIVDQGSTAIEGVHYRLASNTVTIPAGKRTADVQVHGYYDRIEPSDTLQFSLRLVMPEQLEWDLYKDRTRVRMLKGCTFHVEDFTGWCVVTSTFLQDYPGVENTSIQRLIRTERDPNDPNTVIMHNWLFSGYDVRIRFDTSDPAKPLTTMPEDQVMSDEMSVFGKINGDNKILLLLRRVRGERQALDAGLCQEHGHDGRHGGFLLQYHGVDQRRGSRPPREGGGHEKIRITDLTNK